MKKIVILAVILTTTLGMAQEFRQVPQVTVSGEGKISVTPDQAEITVSVENLGKDASEVKKVNDKTIDAVIKAIKKQGISNSD
ncbi:MAG: SIMPL domain-containing protein, partial [Flavobacterium sp.]|nr:SIMPL domain-containing protein [Flavobacterium sp.]